MLYSMDIRERALGFFSVAKEIYRRAIRLLNSGSIYEAFILGYNSVEIFIRTYFMIRLQTNRMGNQGISDFLEIVPIFSTKDEWKEEYFITTKIYDWLSLGEDLYSKMLEGDLDNSAAVEIKEFIFNIGKISIIIENYIYNGPARITVGDFKEMWWEN